MRAHAQQQPLERTAKEQILQLKQDLRAQEMRAGQLKKKSQQQAEALERAASPWAIGGETYGELALLAAIVAMTLLFMLPPAKANYSIDPAGKASNRLHPRGLA